MRGVVVKTHFLFEPASDFEATGLFEITSQWPGTVAEIANVALRSG